MVAHIEMIAKVFSRTNDALSIASKQVVCLSIREFTAFIKIVGENGYCQYPIYKGKRCIGLFSSHDIIQLMSENLVNTMVDITDTRV